MKSAVFAGSFDPVTIGHIDIVERLSQIFDHVYFLEAINIEKVCLFSRQERLEMMRLAAKRLKNVECVATDGMVVDFLEKHNAVQARGVRNEKDYAYERVMAENNQRFRPSTQTVFLMADDRFETVSSSAVKAELEKGRIPQDMVPSEIVGFLIDWVNRYGKQ